MDLAGRVALVTGGATGLGRAIALGLARDGSAVAVNYSRSKAEADETVDEIEALGRRAVAVCADVADDAAVGAMAETVEDALGPIEILVNNAGTTEYIPFADLDGATPAVWERLLRVNLVGAFACVQAAVPQMRRAGAGRILNVASISAFTATGSSIPYVASKSGLVSLTQCLARALAPDVQVNGVAPGWMATRWPDVFLPPELAQRVREGAMRTVEVEDVASFALELIRNDSANGQVVALDRGEMWSR
jgi:3-oxoacyl-[acyl-carrier protein] reductase